MENKPREEMAVTPDELDQVRTYKPVMVFDGVCDHEYSYAAAQIDGEGMAKVPCARCPMGLYIRKEELEAYI